MQQFSLDDLYHYFDGERRDELDRGGAIRRSGQFLALRQKVLALPDEQFELVIRTVENMVKPEGDKKNGVRREGMELFRRSRDGEDRESN